MRPGCAIFDRSPRPERRRAILRGPSARVPAHSEMRSSVPAKRAPVRPVLPSNGVVVVARPRSASRSAAHAAPILVRVFRNGIEESIHRGHIVETDANGHLISLLGDPDRVVTLRSTVKPFGLLSLIEAGGIDEFDLTAPELASWRVRTRARICMSGPCRRCIAGPG